MPGVRKIYTGGHGGRKISYARVIAGAAANTIKRAWKAYKGRTGKQEVTSKASTRRRGGTMTMSNLKVSKQPQETNVRKPLVFTHGRRAGRTNERKMNSLRQALVVPEYYNYTTPLTTSAAIGQTNWGYDNILNLADLAVIRSNLVDSYSTSRYTVTNASIRIQVCNMSSCTAFMRVYEYTPRHDITVSGGNALNIATGGFATLTAGASPLAYTDLSATLFQNPQFVQWYKIEAVRLLEFAPGQVQYIEIFENKAHTLNGEYIEYANASELRGLTRGVVWQVWGQVASDTTTPTLVSTSNIKFDFISTVKYEYREVLNSFMQGKSVNSLGAVAVAQDIDELTGAKIPTTLA